MVVTKGQSQSNLNINARHIIIGHTQEKQTIKLSKAPYRSNIMGDNDSPEQLTDIVKPHHNDVLSGRGNFVNHHSGNENFRKL